MLQDEAGSGRISELKYCWRRKGSRPSVPCYYIREYRYGAEEPLTGGPCVLLMPCCNTICKNIFLEELAMQYPDNVILCCNGAVWHKAGSLYILEKIRLFLIPPYTPEMNPIEQV